MLESALEAIDAGGLKAVTVDNVAQLSGTSNGAIYHRFGSRGGLVAASLDHFLTHFEDQMEASFQEIEAMGDDVAAMVRLVEVFLVAYEANHRRFRAFMVQGNEEQALYERGQSASHGVAARVSSMLTTRFDCSHASAEACFQILLALGASRALFDPGQVVPDPPSVNALAAEVGRALLGVVANSAG